MFITFKLRDKNLSQAPWDAGDGSWRMFEADLRHDLHLRTEKDDIFHIFLGIFRSFLTENLNITSQWDEALALYK